MTSIYFEFAILNNRRVGFESGFVPKLGNRPTTVFFTCAPPCINRCMMNAYIQTYDVYILSIYYIHAVTYTYITYNYVSMYYMYI